VGKKKPFHDVIKKLRSVSPPRGGTGEPARDSGKKAAPRGTRGRLGERERIKVGAQFLAIYGGA